MKHMTLTASALALIMGTTAAVAATNVKEITVETDLSAIQNEEAVTKLNSLDSDLEEAIASRLVNQLSDDGARVLIDIDEVSLANSFQQAIGTEDSVLMGDVSLRIPGIANNENYTLTVSATQAQAYFPEGTVISDLTMGSEIYYDAMINAFADNVAAKLQ